MYCDAGESSSALLSELASRRKIYICLKTQTGNAHFKNNKTIFFYNLNFSFSYCLKNMKCI